LAKAGILLQSVGATEADSDDDDDDEFEYTPGEAWKDDAPEKKDDESKPSVKAALEIPNDGSFLEMMKQKLQQESKEESQKSQKEV
jgi:hypothetical protein